MAKLSPFEMVRALIPKLSAGERAAVMQALKASMQFDGPSTGHDVVAEGGDAQQVSSDVSFLLTTICDYCRGKGLDHTGPVQLQSSSHYKPFEPKGMDYVRWLRGHSINGRHVQRQMTKIALDQLHNVGKPANVPMTSAFCMGNVDRFPAMIDTAFPGYAEAGLLSLVAWIKENQRA